VITRIDLCQQVEKDLSVPIDETFKLRCRGVFARGMVNIEILPRAGKPSSYYAWNDGDTIFWLVVAIDVTGSVRSSAVRLAPISLHLSLPLCIDETVPRSQPMSFACIRD
jgi:hypothetical protein